MLDYAFVRRDDETETIAILLAKDRDSRAMRAWVMRHKGACLEEAGERATEGIAIFGHEKILIKTDNEAALTALRDEATRRLEAGAIPVAPPEGELQSNGAIENGVKVFNGVWRAHLLALDRKVAACRAFTRSWHG